MTMYQIELGTDSEEYKKVSTAFIENNYIAPKNTELIMNKVFKIENPNLRAKFDAQKVLYNVKYGHYKTYNLFHGTKSMNVPSILVNNLDPSRHGTSTGHRFGAGTSFSRQASYASHYCDKGVTGQMLLCEVIISNTINVPETKNGYLTELPYLPDGSGMRFDTTAKNKLTMDVIVKLKENEFYPAYLIHFSRRKRTCNTPWVFSDISMLQRIEEMLRGLHFQ